MAQLDEPGLTSTHVKLSTLNLIYGILLLAIYINDFFHNWLFTKHFIVRFFVTLTKNPSINRFKVILMSKKTRL